MPPWLLTNSAVAPSFFARSTRAPAESSRSVHFDRPVSHEMKSGVARRHRQHSVLRRASRASRRTPRGLLAGYEEWRRTILRIAVVDVGGRDAATRSEAQSRCPRQQASQSAVCPLPTVSSASTPAASSDATSEASPLRRPRGWSCCWPARASAEGKAAAPSTLQSDSAHWGVCCYVEERRATLDWDDNGERS